MLLIEVKGETFNEETNRFFELDKPITLKLEHSLLSVSKWESIWKIPFIPTVAEEDTKTPEQYLSYIKCMTINQGVPDEAYSLLTPEDFQKINDYISDEQTATWFSKQGAQGKGDHTVVTSELIYYWMTAQQIPWEAQKWHLSRLFTLIHICSIKNSPPKKMAKRDILQQNKALNEARRKAARTKG